MMDPLTINLNGIEDVASQFGPHGYMIVEGIAFVVFAFLTWRQITKEGVCYGKCNDEDKHNEHKAMGDAHSGKAVMCCILTIVSLVSLISSSSKLFNISIEKMKNGAAVDPESSMDKDELNDWRERVSALQRNANSWRNKVEALEQEAKDQHNYYLQTAKELDETQLNLAKTERELARYTKHEGQLR